MEAREVSVSSVPCSAWTNVWLTDRSLSPEILVIQGVQMDAMQLIERPLVLYCGPS